jgi:hypothetical protein
VYIDHVTYFNRTTTVNNPTRAYSTIRIPCPGARLFTTPVLRQLLILQLLVEAHSLKKVRLRVFLTSRPDTPIRHGFDQISEDKHRHIVLHNISTLVINHDISVFLTHELGLIGRGNYFPDNWLGLDVIADLLRKANGLIIWAATACRFIGGGPLAKKRVAAILAGEIDAESPEGHLNHLYTSVLQSSIPQNYSEKFKQELYILLRNILGSIAILLSPLSVNAALGRGHGYTATDARGLH